MKAYKIMARCRAQRVQRQDLTGNVVTDYPTAWKLAEQLAQKQTAQTGDAWTADVEEYTVGYKPGTELL